jgi:hypothetical protein
MQKTHVNYANQAFKMKNTGNNGIGNTAERDLWRTEQFFFDSLDKQYYFTFDCCANEDNNKCVNFSNDFLSIKNLENHICWINPPFTKAEVMFKHFFTIVKKGVGIYRCDNLETKTWQNIILKNADWVFIPKGRVSYTPFFETSKGRGCRFPSALIGIGVLPPESINGTILFIKKQ